MPVWVPQSGFDPGLRLSPRKGWVTPLTHEPTALPTPTSRNLWLRQLLWVTFSPSEKHSGCEHVADRARRDPERFHGAGEGSADGGSLTSRGCCRQQDLVCVFRSVQLCGVPRGPRSLPEPPVCTPWPPGMSTFNPFAAFIHSKYFFFQNASTSHKKIRS